VAAAAGKKLYLLNCAQCHGNNLQGEGPAPPLDRAFQRFQRRHQPPRRGVDIDGGGLGVARTIGGMIAHSAHLP